MPRGAAPLRRSAVPLLRVFATAAENAREAREKSTASPQANSWERKEESRFELETGPWAGLEEALPPARKAGVFVSYSPWNNVQSFGKSDSPLRPYPAGS